MNPRNFFAELKRRNVYKVAVTYAVVESDRRFAALMRKVRFTEP